MRDPIREPLAVPIVQEQLRNVAKLLREVHPLGLDLQRLLAEFLAELSDALGGVTVASDRLAHLIETTAHMAAALHEQKETHLLGGLRDRMERAVAGVEGHYPTLAGLGRRFLDALTNIGI